MNIGAALPPEEPATVFFVGQHETQRSIPVSSDQLGQAQYYGYDFLTTPITTSDFHLRVISLISAHFDSLSVENSPDSHPLPTISALTPADTTLTPEDSNTSLVAIASPWIDLGSKDPIIAHVSRQILSMEVAYAAFCGINNILVYGPSPNAEGVQFSRAIHEALGLGPYLQLHILLPMTGELELEHGDSTHLSELARESEEPEEPETFGAWDIWNTIRTICKYSHKLSIGTKFNFLFSKSYRFPFRSPN